MKSQEKRRSKVVLSVGLWFVVAVFFVISAIGVMLIGYHAFQKDLKISPLIIAIPIGLGIYRRHEGWRICAIVVGLLGMLVVIPLVCIAIGAMNSVWIPSQAHRYIYLFAALNVLILFCSAWCLRILSSAHSRRFFLQTELSKFASFLPCLLLLLAVLLTSRLTGGIGGSISRKFGNVQDGAISNGNKLSDFIPIQPLILEFQYDDETTYRVLATQFSREPSRGGVRTRWIEKFWEFRGSVVPHSISHAPNKIIIQVQDDKIEGNISFPVIKKADCELSALVSGSGRYDGFQFFSYVKQTRTAVGLSTTANFRKSWRQFCERRISSAVRKSAFASPKSLSGMEFSHRIIQLSCRELEDLRSEYRNLADGYISVGDIESAFDSYKQCLFVSELILTDRMRELAQCQRWQNASSVARVGDIYLFLAAIHRCRGKNLVDQEYENKAIRWRLAHSQPKTDTLERGSRSDRRSIPSRNRTGKSSKMIWVMRHRSCVSARIAAAVQLSQSDFDGYQETAKILLEEFSNTDDPTFAESVAWVCTWRPNALLDSDQVLKLANLAVSQNAEDARSLRTLGAVHYRRGEYAEAIFRLEQALNVSSNNGSPFDWAFLSMAHFKRGDRSLSRDFYQKMQDSLARNSKFGDQLDSTPTSVDEAILQSLHVEAGNLIDEIVD